MRRMERSGTNLVIRSVFNSKCINDQAFGKTALGLSGKARQGMSFDMV